MAKYARLSEVQPFTLKKLSYFLKDNIWVYYLLLITKFLIKLLKLLSRVCLVFGIL